MRCPRGTALYLLLLTGLCSPAVTQNVAQTASLRRVQVLGNKGAVEIEIEASDRLIPKTQVLSGPDRLVIDFPNTTPGAQLRSQSVDRGAIKSLRVGLFQANPPVTRLVIDLKSPQSYEVFPYGRTVMIKFSGAAPAQEADGVDYFPPVTRPGLVNTSFPANRPAMRPAALQTGPATKPSLEVTFHDGLLSIRANKTSLSEVLFAVHQRTGAEVAVTAGAEQEQVVADIGPGPAPEVLARLLNGSRFNFLILNSPEDPRKLDRVILSPRSEGGSASAMPPPPSSSSDDSDEDAATPATAGIGAPAPPPPTAGIAAPAPPAPTAGIGAPAPPPPGEAGGPAVREASPRSQPEDKPAEDNSPD